ncbi:MAG: response regulator [Deltaproteobacteria bacterium]|nr:response regulator [Deltaproteobacteria bacterium]
MPKKILLADDSVTIQKVVTLTLSSEDYELIIAGDGNSAIEKIRKVKPDLIMADIAMPGKNGYEVCEIVKNDPQLKNVPVLLLSGTFETLDADEAEKAGADDHIVKPFESEELINKVRDLLSRSTRPREPAPQEETPSPAPLYEESPPLGEEVWLDSDFIGSGKGEEALKPAHPEETGPGLEEEFLDIGLGEEELKETEGLPEGTKEEEECEEYIEEPPILELLEEEETTGLRFPGELTLKTAEEPVLEETAPKGVEASFEASGETLRMEEPIRAVEEPAERVREITAAPGKEKAGTKIKGLETFPMEKLEEIIERVVREVVTEIAWEVVPEVAEDIIKKELIERLRQAMARPK